VLAFLLAPSKPAAFGPNLTISTRDGVQLMITVIRCPRTGGGCSDAICRDRSWCRKLLERGLSRRGLPLCRSTTTAVEGISVTPEGFLRFRVTPHNARTRAYCCKNGGHTVSRDFCISPRALPRFRTLRLGASLSDADSPVVIFLQHHQRL
jgi:hypothetical protein